MKGPTRKESVLYAPYANIFDGVLGHFNLKTSRSVFASHKKRLARPEGVENNRLRSSPDFIIQGWGPLFSLPVRDTTFPFWFGTCASPVDIKTERDVQLSDKFLPHLVQLAVYARECFIQQQNRFFVYAIILTEEHVRLYQFDRSGVQYSPLVNIHDRPSHFVRILLGISSHDGEKLGFDTSIRWEEGIRYLYTVDGDNEPIRYEFVFDTPVFSRPTIRGRGTLCNEVFVPDSDSDGMHLVKDAWRSQNRSPEWEFLKAAKGLAGVGQMVSYEETGLITSKHRGIDMASLVDAPNPAFQDMTFYRLTLEAYGGTIDDFKSRKQLLYAFRDAIAGHQNLWKNSILHRDISTNNILLGNEGAERGNRGLVIDLDAAAWINRTGLPRVNLHIGTRAFQSLMVLSSAHFGSAATAHDYLDDLEAFFYVLCWICFTYDRPGHQPDKLPVELAKWEAQDAVVSANAKFEVLSHPIEDTPEYPISSYFGEVFLNLLENLRKFSTGHMERKVKSLRTPRENCETVMAQSDEHYAEVLGYVDVAIAAVEALPEEKVDDKPQPPIIPGKRPSSGVPDDSPETKRLKTEVQGQSEVAAGKDT